MLFLSSSHVWSDMCLLRVQCRKRGRYGTRRTFWTPPHLRWWQLCRSTSAVSATTKRPGESIATPSGCDVLHTPGGKPEQCFLSCLLLPHAG